MVPPLARHHISVYSMNTFETLSSTNRIGRGAEPPVRVEREVGVVLLFEIMPCKDDNYDNRPREPQARRQTGSLWKLALAVATDDGALIALAGRIY